ncbi:3'(2'),5'-bisphosphate nucleotidase CysQ [Clostridiaceae bacterium HSG29]|nr:3'(2'),5'-bisphosphate nucleotidase CysQ [Clostridiaceae bacterium HSG29]
MYEKELKICKEVVLEASKKILEIYNTDFKVMKKEDKSPITLADIEANRIIIARLKEEFDYLLVSEESVKHKQFCDKNVCFIIDPIDGTKEFVKKNGEFTVNIAMLKNDVLVMGVVYAPVLDEMYYAIKGEGAFFEKDGTLKKINVSDRIGKVNVLISRSHQWERSVKLLEENKNRIINVTRMGSSLKGCKIAAGEQDIYYRFGPTCIWDTAAMQIIVEEAGGVLKLLNGNKINYKKKNYINEEFYIVNDERNKMKI